MGEYFPTPEGKGKGKVRVIPIPDSKSELGFVLNQDDKELKDAINKAIADMKKMARMQNHKKWFNQKAPNPCRGKCRKHWDCKKIIIMGSLDRMQKTVFGRFLCEGRR